MCPDCSAPWSTRVADGQLDATALVTPPLRHRGCGSRVPAARHRPRRRAADRAGVLIEPDHRAGAAPPGESLEEKFETAQAWGYDGIELRGEGDFHFASRLPELVAGPTREWSCRRRASRCRTSSVPSTATCAKTRSPSSPPSSASWRRSAASALMTPGSYGMFSRRLPPFEPPRTAPKTTTSCWPDSAGSASIAQKEGVTLFLEPLNRYEDYLVNRLWRRPHSSARSGRRACGSSSTAYHMNIEEADPAAAIWRSPRTSGTPQASDSNRFEPGAGHLDWPACSAHRLSHRVRALPRCGVPADGDPLQAVGRRPRSCAGRRDYGPLRSGGTCDRPGRPGGSDAAVRCCSAIGAAAGTAPFRLAALPPPVELGLGLHRHRPAPRRPGRARLELETRSLAAQWADGRLPQIVFDTGRDDGLLAGR